MDRDAALDLIDQLRVAVPEEVRHAKRINQESERILEKAHEEAQEIVARAQEQAALLIDERGLTEAAQEQSRRIIAQAELDAEDVRRGADDYASDILGNLQASVAGTLRSIERGLGLLDERRAAYEPAPADTGDYPAADGYADNRPHDDEDVPAPAPRR